MSTSQIADVLIIGGGPAGLACATGLARLVHTVILFDSGVYRNARSKHMHTVVTWDHRDPADFRAAARKDLLARYHTTTFIDVQVAQLQRLESGLFRATDSLNNQHLGRKVVLATGVHDIPAPIPGYDQCWTTGIFHCLFCHGYEERASASAGVLAIGLVATPLRALHYAHNALQLAETATVYTNGAAAVASAMSAALPAASRRIRVDDRVIVRLEKSDRLADVVVHFADGTQVTENFLVHSPDFKQNGGFAEQLGCEITEGGDLLVKLPFQETSVHGVFAAGDCGSMMKAAVMALSTGAGASAGVAAQLEQEKEAGMLAG